MLVFLSFTFKVPFNGALPRYLIAYLDDLLTLVF